MPMDKINSIPAPTILIVDDVSENRKLLASLLKENITCRIMLAKAAEMLRRCLKTGI